MVTNTQCVTEMKRTFGKVADVSPRFNGATVVHNYSTYNVTPNKYKGITLYVRQVYMGPMKIREQILNMFPKMKDSLQIKFREDSMLRISGFKSLSDISRFIKWYEKVVD